MNLKRFSISISLILLLGLSPVASGSAGVIQKAPKASNAHTRKVRKPPTNADTQKVKKPLTNADIIRMVQAEITDDEIIETIQANDTKFDVNGDDIIQLKTAGVSQKVRDAMRAAEAPIRATQDPTQPAPKSDVTVLPTGTSQTPPLQQPYAQLVQGEAKRNLSRAATQMAQAKNTGENDLASIAVSVAVNNILTRDLSEKLTSGMKNALRPIENYIGPIPIPRELLDPRCWLGGCKVTYLWAVPDWSSSNALQTNTPKLEIAYDNIAGINPDEYQPVIIKLASTQNNWRLVGATKAKINVYKTAAPKWEVYSSFAEESVPTRLNKLGRGHVQIEPEQPLDPGDYGLVLRPISKVKKFSGADVWNGRGEGVLFNSVWDFLVGPRSGAQ